MTRKTVNFALTEAMDELFVASYVQHYSTINPWVNYISDSPASKVLLTERDYPASSFRNSEFFEDWLSPQQNMDAFAGLKVQVDPRNEICIGWHYGARQAPACDAVASSILEGLRSSVTGAIQSAMLVREKVEDELRLGAMIEQIDGAALMVERNRRIREANEQAVAALQKGSVLVGAGNVLSIRDPASQRWLEDTVSRLADDDTVAAMTTTIGNEGGVFRMTATLAPDFGDRRFPLLLQPRRRVLLVVRPLSSGSNDVDGHALRVAFGLSAGEVRLCELLLNGRSLTEAAQLLGVSDGTIRQRVKMIFHKTRTHRQGELIALLARFGVGRW